jgi:hypothetical protein
MLEWLSFVFEVQYSVLQRSALRLLQYFPVGLSNNLSDLSESPHLPLRLE